MYDFWCFDVVANSFCCASDTFAVSLRQYCAVFDVLPQDNMTQARRWLENAGLNGQNDTRRRVELDYYVTNSGRNTIQGTRTKRGELSRCVQKNRIVAS